MKDERRVWRAWYTTGGRLFEVRAVLLNRWRYGECDTHHARRMQWNASDNAVVSMLIISGSPTGPENVKRAMHRVTGLQVRATWKMGRMAWYRRHDTDGQENPSCYLGVIDTRPVLCSEKCTIDFKISSVNQLYCMVIIKYCNFRRLSILTAKHHGLY